MKTKAVILAGGEGSRLGILTSKRTKPAVPFGGKYRIIDFALSNCINSGIVDVMIVAQYRPHSLIEHIGSGAPWDLNRDFTGGVRIYTPYLARRPSDWFLGTADAVQQNFAFIKSTSPDLVLILSGDHIYQMNYDAMVKFHIENKADLTMAALRVPTEEASRFGIVGFDDENRVTSFVEKPANPPSNMANMGVYIFNLSVLDLALWEDQKNPGSSHDFGKDILPNLIAGGKRVFAYPYSGYWVDVGTIPSYWAAHMDLLEPSAGLNLYDRSWVIHTRTEERPPVRIASGAEINDSMLSDGCVISSGVLIERSILSPGVVVKKGAVIRDSVVLTDAVIYENGRVLRAILDKRVKIGAGAIVGGISKENLITMVGKNSDLPEGLQVQAGATIGADVIPSDFDTLVVKSDEFIETKRLPNEI